MKTAITAFLIAVAGLSAAPANAAPLDGKGNDPYPFSAERGPDTPVPGERINADWLPQDMDPY